MQRKQEFNMRSDWGSRDGKSYEPRHHRQRAHVQRALARKLARKVKALINISSKGIKTKVLNVIYNMFVGISHHLRRDDGKNTEGEIAILRYKKTNIAKHMNDVLNDFGFKTQFKDEYLCFCSGTSANELERLSCFHKQAKVFKKHGFTQMCQGYFWTFETPTPSGACALRKLLIELNKLIPAFMLWDKSYGFHARFV